MKFIKIRDKPRVTGRMAVRITKENLGEILLFLLTLHKDLVFSVFGDHSGSLRIDFGSWLVDRGADDYKLINRFNNTSDKDYHIWYEEENI
ncbi:MAG: hypothetical protein LBR80_08350 [Deltaproteobacteria bacterium]|jgi:hypothetical protein|nr:hypothetical protein [Deltaproteobacteria bacterium]